MVFTFGGLSWTPMQILSLKDAVSRYVLKVDVAPWYLELLCNFAMTVAFLGKSYNGDTILFGDLLFARYILNLKWAGSLIKLYIYIYKLEVGRFLDHIYIYIYMVQSQKTVLKTLFINVSGTCPFINIYIPAPLYIY